MRVEVIKHYKTKPPVKKYYSSVCCETVRELIRVNEKWENTAVCISPETEKDKKRLIEHLTICHTLHLEERS